MENRLNKKIEQYISEVKDAIKTKIVDMGFEDKGKINELIAFVYDYDRLVLNKEDFIKRKRVKNTVPTTNRCNAKRANGDQCTRRRKKDCEYCGTHSKGTPHGVIFAQECKEQMTEKLEVVAEEVKGIVYYIDKHNNVYNTEDVLKGIDNPRVIAKCVKQNGTVTIPELGLV